MKRFAQILARTAVATLCLALGAVAAAPAQGRGGGGPPPGGGGMGGPGGGGPGGGMGGPQFPGGGQPINRGPVGTSEPQPGQRSSGGDVRPALQIGPPGQRWWDDKSMVKSLKLRPDQQTHMDAIFEQNRGALLTRLQSVQQAETQMDALAKSPTLDEGVLFSQIDRVAQARAELEKATTHMLLQIRREMDADQIKRLEKASQR